MDIIAEEQLLLEQIQQRADPEYRSGTLMMTRTGLKLYGVRVPHLREIATSWQRTHKDAARGDLMALIERLWDGISQEERALAMELLRRYQRHILTLEWAHFDRWRRKVDNWSLTDMLGAYILAPWLLADRETRLARLWDLIGDDDLWSRRLALVATTQINRGRAGPTIPKLTLDLIDRVKEERDPMMTKAVSWALREMIKSHADQVTAYLEANQGILAAHVIREVRNKLRTGLKSGKDHSS